MDKLSRYIFEAPLCKGINGKGCSDYMARRDGPEHDKNRVRPNKYCAILVDYETKRLYYDDLCESCRFKNEVTFVIACIRKNGSFHANPSEHLTFKSPSARPKVGNFSMYSEKKYCDEHNNSATKRPGEDKKNITINNYIFDKNFSSDDMEDIMDPEKLEERKKRFKRKREDITPKVNPQSREEIEMNIAYMEQMLAQMRENK
jgi:hypothetical protein